MEISRQIMQLMLFLKEDYYRKIILSSSLYRHIIAYRSYSKCVKFYMEVGQKLATRHLKLFKTNFVWVFKTK
jgi:hypothetical protein